MSKKYNGFDHNAILTSLLYFIAKKNRKIKCQSATPQHKCHEHLTI